MPPVNSKNHSGLRRHFLSSATPLQSTPPLPRHFHTLYFEPLPLSCQYSYAHKITAIRRLSNINHLHRPLCYFTSRKAASSMAVKVPIWPYKLFLTCPISQAADDSKITNWADKSTGEFKRGQSQFRSRISNKPNAEFPAEKGRYHLYVSYACPWGKFPNQPVSISYLLKIYAAHRTLIVRKLKGLEEIIPYTAVHWEMLEKGVLHSSSYFHPPF